MRVTRIEIDNLHFHLNHSIELKDKGITIIYGLNSSGKTTILHLINTMFTIRDYASIIYFDTFQIWFDNSKYLKIETKPEDFQFFFEQPFRKSVYSTNEENAKSFSVGLHYLSQSSGMLKQLEKSDILEYEFINDLERIIMKRVHIEHSKEEIKHESLRLRRKLLKYFESHKCQYMVENWFNKLNKKINTKLIQTQRIQNVLQYWDFPHLYDFHSTEDFDEEVEIVLINSNNIKETISHLKIVAREKINTLDGTSQDRLEEYLKLMKYKKISEKKLRNKMRKLGKKIDWYLYIGIIDDITVKELDKILSQKIMATKFGRTCFEINEVEKKLKYYDQLGNRIKLFNDLLSTKFLRKKVEVNGDEGIAVISPGSIRIPLERLSSGEKQTLIIFYELLFNTPPNTLVLIDEPELSLHVGWQQDFINDLIKIQKINKLYFLIATHSPQIICDHWDLTVELEVPNE